MWADDLNSGISNWQGRPVWAEIDLDALQHNVRLLKQRAQGNGRPAALYAVVKANAYGHGAVPVARAALEAGADALSVICVDEGCELRAAGIQAPILVMGHTPIAQAATAVEQGLTLTVNSLQLGLALSRAAVERDAVQRVHVKVETGLNRYGSDTAEAVALAEALRDLPGIRVEGLFTHFASPEDEDKTYTLQQYVNFMAAADALPWITHRHAANTATVLDAPELCLDGVRTGIGMYGCSPAPNLQGVLGLRPVLSLKTRVARLRRLQMGESVSYGRTWTARRPSAVATIMCGYGEGLRRVLSNRGEVLVRGRRAPIAGRVAMDMSIIDVTDVPGVALDDEVVIIGRQGEAEITAAEVAALCDTISYEILTGIPAAVPRLYYQRGRLTGTLTATGRYVRTEAAAARVGSTEQT